MTGTHRPHLLGLAIACALCAATAHADDTTAPNKPRELEAVQVQGNVLGSSSKENVRTYAGSRKVIGSEDLATGANRSLDDALQQVPGIKIFDETGTGVLPQIMTALRSRCRRTRSARRVPGYGCARRCRCAR